MVESDIVDEVLGDLFVLILLCVLEGYCGILFVVLQYWLDVVELFFEYEQIIFVNVGILFCCIVVIDFGNGLFVLVSEEWYKELNVVQVDMLVGFLEIEDCVCCDCVKV